MRRRFTLRVLSRIFGKDLQQSFYENGNKYFTFVKLFEKYFNALYIKLLSKFLYKCKRECPCNINRGLTSDYKIRFHQSLYLISKNVTEILKQVTMFFVWILDEAGFMSY